MATAFVLDTETPARRPDLSLVPPPRRPRHLVPTRLVVALLAIAGFLLVMTSVGADQPTVTEAYLVQPGDTLWSIADRTAGDTDDVRVVVYEIRDMNDLASSALQPGQVLQLPAG